MACESTKLKGEGDGEGESNGKGGVWDVDREDHAGDWSWERPQEEEVEENVFNQDRWEVPKPKMSLAQCAPKIHSVEKQGC